MEVGVRSVRGSDVPPPLGPLETAGRQEGHSLVERTVAEWRSGANRFDKLGEDFLLATHGHRLVGMCGLNVDPFLGDPSVGRLRHLYVAPEVRREGVGSVLVEACLAIAAASFNRVRLRTFDHAADLFYRSLGFNPVDEPDATHSIDLEGRA